MAITKKWAGNGIKTPIPNEPQGDNLVNYDEGFTTPYRTPIKDGGEPIKLDTFNQLMYDITDEIIENKSTLNQVAAQINNIIDDSQTTATMTWSSVKISAEIGQGGGGDASIDDNTIATDKVWSSYKTNQMVKGGKTISISNFQTKSANADTEFVNDGANAQIVNLNVKVKTTKGTAQGGDQYLGEVVVYYNSTAQEVLRESVISQNITGAPNDEITSALGSVVLDAQDTLLVKGEPATLWDDTEIDGYTANLTTEAPEPTPLGEGLTFIAQASNSSVTFNKFGSPTELQLEYQTTIADITSSWQAYTLGTTIDLSPNDKVAFRNTGTQTITQSDSAYHFFTMTGEIKAENDLTYLFSSAGGVTSIGEYGCYKMFNNCSALTEMPDLNATNIGSNGYANMFEGCSKLKTIKSLNATTLSNYAYKEMFKNCSELIISESSGESEFLTMPATAPGNTGDNMFIGTGGRFTGTPTASKSYYYNATMPATDILRFTAIAANQRLVFDKTDGATEVTRINLEMNKNGDGWVPYNHGTILTFQNAGEYVEFRNQGLQHPTNLTESIKCGHFFGGPQDNVQARFYVSGNLMYLYDKTGEKLNMPAWGFAGLFGLRYYRQNFTFKNLQLPATTLAEGCYDNMFGGLYASNSFEGELPALPATVLFRKCYNYMFNKTTFKDGFMPQMATPTTLAESCYYYMFSEVRFPKHFITEETGLKLFFTTPNVTQQSLNNAGGENIFKYTDAESIKLKPNTKYFYNDK